MLATFIHVYTLTHNDMYIFTIRYIYIYIYVYHMRNNIYIEIFASVMYKNYTLFLP